MIKYTVTAELPCQVPGVGTFAAGETKELTAEQMRQFEAVMGQPPQKMVWPNNMHFVAELGPDVPADAPTEAGEV